MSQEQWKPVKGFDGYEVSNLGRIRSKTRKVAHRNSTRTYHGKVLSQRMGGSGYLFVTLSKEGEQFSRYVHRLVAYAFVDGHFDGAQVNHKDGDKTNNKASNLEWVTQSQNMSHAHTNGLIPPPPSQEKFSLCECAKAIAEYIETDQTYAQVAQKHEISESHLYYLVQGNKRPKALALYEEKVK